MRSYPFWLTPSGFASIARLLAWACVLVIAILSLVPGEVRPHTGLPGPVEHFIAYAGTALFFALGYSGSRQWMLALIGLAIAGGAFEVSQNLVPGRSPSLFDALASTSGAVFGLLSGVILSAVASGKRLFRLSE